MGQYAFKAQALDAFRELISIPGVLLVDPPVGDFYLRNFRLQSGDDTKMRFFRRYHSLLYQGGYVDFNPWPSTIHSFACLEESLRNRGPQRVSMLDDIVHYWSNNTQHEYQSPGDPIESTIFAKKIALANWMLLLEYVQTCIRKLEFRRQRLEAASDALDEKGPISHQKGLRARFTDVERTLTLWSRRWLIFREQVEINILQLGLRRGDHLIIRPNQSDQNFEGLSDWEYILARLSFFSERTDQLSTDAVAFSSNQSTKGMEMMQRDSEEDNKNIALLTKLGAVFLPAGLTASLLSMPAPFGPGQSLQFWLFWSIAAPFILVFIVLALMPSIRKTKTFFLLEPLFLVRHATSWIPFM